jgi:four helix bundle protein
MEGEELKRRTKDFALQIIGLVESLPRSRSADVIGQQILRSATSIGANYRAACKARSRADFISKITVVEEEADESLYWLELLADSGILKKEQLGSLIREARELTAIFTASGKTAKRRR